MKDKIRGLKLPSFLTSPDPSIYLGDNYVVFDFETTNRDKGSAGSKDNRLILSTWCLGPEHPHVSNIRELCYNGIYYGEGFPDALATAIASAEYVVCQNGKFEYQWLSRLGYDVQGTLLYDTYLGAYVEDGNRRGERNLNALAERYGFPGKVSVVSELIKGGVCPSEIPEKWLVEYGCRDTALTHQVFLKQRQVLKKLGLLGCLFTRCIATPVLADIEMNGMQLDPVAVEEKYDSLQHECRGITEQLNKVTCGINLNSPKQVGSFLYDELGFTELSGRDGRPDRTESDGRRTDADTITRLICSTAAQREFQNLYKHYRKLAKSLESLEKMNDCCVQNGGLLHASYNQAVTQTHRLSSSGSKYKLQFHNFDRRNKPLFKARHPGWRIGEADGSQLEFRVAGHLGRDKQAGEDIRDPSFDAHYNTASVLLNKSREEISDEERTEGKKDTFKPLFGGMSGTPEQRRYYKFFQERYSGIYSTQKGWTYEVLKTGQLRTETGLIFYWPGTKMSKSGYIDNTTSIFNYPIQSLATADIIPISLVYFWHRAKALGLALFLCNTVHDSIVVELPEEEEDVFRDLAEITFTEDVFSYLSKVYSVAFTVPLGTETKVGTHWGVGKKRKYDLDPIDYFKEVVL